MISSSRAFSCASAAGRFGAAERGEAPALRGLMAARLDITLSPLAAARSLCRLLPALKIFRQQSTSRDAHSVGPLPRLQPNSGLPEFGHREGACTKIRAVHPLPTPPP